MEKKSGTKQVKEGGERKGRRERRETTDFYLKIRGFKGVSSPQVNGCERVTIAFKEVAFNE